MNKLLPRSTPEAMGVDPAAITRFLDAMETGGIELHGFMMLRHGHVIAEGWWKPYGPEKPHMLFSLSKSFTSTAVGFAVAEGLLSVDDPVLKFFPEEAPEKPGRHWADMKVRHLLSMSTGHDKDTTGFMINRRDGDWAGSFLRQPLKHKPGAHFLYNTGATYMLSVIVQKLTGQRVFEYLTPRMFEPLGIEGAMWEQCPRGYDTGGFGLSIRTEDIARFGQFLLQRGMWEGRQLLPAAWIDEATSKQVENGPADGTTDWGEGYGYQFWRCVPEGTYRGDGAFGQYCVVIPRLDTVFAINGGLPDMQAVLTHLWKILPAIGDPRPEDNAARQAMETKLAGLRYNPPVLEPNSPLEADVSGKAFVLDKNPDRLKKIGFDFHEGHCDVRLTYGRKTFTLAAGRGRWAMGPYPIRTMHSITPLELTEAAASFTWQDKRTLLLTVRAVTTPFVMTTKIVFGEDGIELKNSVNVSFGPVEAPAVKGQLIK